VEELKPLSQLWQAYGLYLDAVNLSEVFSLSKKEVDTFSRLKLYALEVRLSKATKNVKYAGYLKFDEHCDINYKS
jgi:hypothetical protein